MPSPWNGAAWLALISLAYWCPSILVVSAASVMAAAFILDRVFNRA